MDKEKIKKYPKPFMTQTILDKFDSISFSWKKINLLYLWHKQEICKEEKKLIIAPFEI